MKLPDPPLLLVTDRHQARLPLVDVVRAALAAGCRWVSMREKDLSEDDQIALASTLLPIARRHGARLTLHGDAALAKACGSDGVHLSAGSDPAARAKLLGPDKLIGVSLHTVDRGRGARSRRRRLCDRGARLRDREQARLWSRNRAQGAGRNRPGGAGADPRDRRRSTPRGPQKFSPPDRPVSPSWAASCARSIRRAR